MRHALRRRYSFGGRRRVYRGWTIVSLRGEFDILDKRGRRKGIAMSMEDAKDMIDDEMAGHSREPGSRDPEEMMRAADAPTVIPPPSTKTMRGQIEYDRALRAAKERRK